tara:strand:+ start:977 stop:1345 length:369 start_codon:yes stop_codon:yes gene_type:complete
MNVEIDATIAHVLEKDFKKFKSRLFDLDDTFYEDYKSINNADETFYNYFVYSIINEKGRLQKVYNKLVNAGCDKKKINDLFYKHLKFHHKVNTNQWSWNELNELDLDIPLDQKINFSNYKFF